MAKERNPPLIRPARRRTPLVVPLPAGGVLSPKPLRQLTAVVRQLAAPALPKPRIVASPSTSKPAAFYLPVRYLQARQPGAPPAPRARLLPIPTTPNVIISPRPVEVIVLRGRAVPLSPPKVVPPAPRLRVTMRRDPIPALSIRSQAARPGPRSQVIVPPRFAVNPPPIFPGGPKFLITDPGRRLFLPDLGVNFNLATSGVTVALPLE